MLKKIAVAMVAAGGLMVAAMPAHAGGHVSLSIGLPVPGVYVGPGYYGPPAPAYAPAYAPSYAPTYYAPPVVYDAPYPGYYGPRYYGPRVVYREGWRGGWHGGDRGGWRGGDRGGYGHR